MPQSSDHASHSTRHSHAVQHFTVTRGSRLLEAWLRPVGEDWVAVVGGGDRPHIGAVAMGFPKPSVRMSSTRPDATGSDSQGLDPMAVEVTAFNLPHHREEPIARSLAEAMARKSHRTVVVTVGIHEDHLDPEGIQIFLEMTAALEAQIIRDWTASLPNP